MNYNKLVVNLLTATLILTAVVGCKKAQQRPTPIPGLNPAVGGEKTTGPIMPPGGLLPGGPVVTPGGPDVTSEGYKLDPNGPKTDWPSDNGETFQSQIVYFDFDKSTIKSSERPKVEEVARRMKSEFLPQGKALRIEGHCDERGTEEYNRALGERRALAVREMLIHLGLAPNMVETISYGEDRPAVPGHNEAAWSKNRRAVFDLLTPPTRSANK